jgi:hypothetical protein
LVIGVDLPSLPQIEAAVSFPGQWIKTALL